ncbi:MAG: FlgO family outer membrane protein [Myxococcota bacterium]
MLVGLVATLGAASESHAASRTLAVSYFDNNSGDVQLDPLARGLADMLITDLGQIGSLQIVERAKLNEVMKELDLSRSKFIDPKTALKLGKGLAAAYILSGGYLVAGDTMRIDVRIFEVATGKVLAGDKVEGGKDDFFSLEKDLVDILVKAIDVKLAGSEKSALRKNATESFDAFKAYSQGLAYKDAGDDDKARAAFQAALDADPGYKAARDAIDRLKAIFRIDDSQKATAYDQARAALDPKATDFGLKVAQLFQMLNGTDRDSVRKKVELLAWLQERGLEPPLPPLSPVPFQALVIAMREAEDPSMEDAVIGTCEYFIGAYPNEDYPKTYCRTIVQMIEGLKKGGTVAERQARYQESVDWDMQNVGPDDWRRALHENEDGMRRLLKGYAKRVKHH